MKVYSLPFSVRGLIFDLDSTLYEHPDYARSQVESQIELLARRWNRDPAELQLEIYQKEAEWTRSRGGRKPSFGNLLLEVYGIDIAESVRLREEAIHPERWLQSDPRLRRTLLALHQRYSMVLLTNNPSSIGQRSLRALDLQDCFDAVVGLETTLKSKPSPEPFWEALRVLNVAAKEAVSIGDRYAVDIEVPLRMGMGGILVEGLEDTRNLDQVLLGPS